MKKAFCEICKKEYPSIIGDKEIRDCWDKYRGSFELCNKCWGKVNREIKDVKEEGTKKIINILEKYKIRNI